MLANRMMLTGLLLLWMRCGPQQSAAQGDRFSVPCSREADGAILILSATAEPGRTLRLGVDTGAQVCAMTRACAHGLGLAERTVATGHGASKAVAGVQAVTLKRLRLGGLTFADVAFQVVDDKDPIFAHDLRVDGVVGMNVLAPFAVEMDYDAPSVSLWLGGAGSPSDVEAAGFARSRSVRLDVAADNVIVSGVLEGRVKGRFLVDTGSAVTGALASLVHRSGAPTIFTAQARVSIGARTKRDVALTKSLSIDGCELGSTFVDHLAGGPRPGTDGILGSDVLARHRVLIDLPGRRMLLAERIVPNAKGIGIDVRVLDTGRWLVTGARTDAAASGITVGDWIISVDGVSTRVLHPADMSRLIASSAGKRLSMVVRRAGTSRERTVRLSVR